jgi:ferric-dicitrate binding protein FerR (iron transport regulator)
MTEQDKRPAGDRGGASPDAIERLLRRAGSRPVGDDERTRRVRDAVQIAWRDSIRQRTRRRRTLGALILAAAAAIVIGVSLTERTNAPASPSAPLAARLTAATGTLGRLDSRAPVRVGDSAVVGSTFETGTGVLATFALAEGGEVRMNAGTVVHFAGMRDVRVDRGAIYLDSGSRSGSLVVRTPVGVVRDVGTRFEVGAVGGAWRVRVRDGLVRYEGAVSHQARAGYELIVEPGGRVIERPSTTYGADWGWVVRAAPPFHVEGQTLAAFLDWVARESGRRVELSSDQLRRAVSGTILHGSIETLTPEEALDAVLPTCGLSHRIESQRVIVSALEPRAGGAR